MSDLREALERIVAQRGSSHVVGVINMSELRELLTAHPPEPSPEVVVDHRPGVTCSVAAEVDPETGFARPLLDRDDVREAIRDEFLWVGPEIIEQNVETSVGHVMELARPMPTREQIAAALSTHYHHPVFGCECTPMHDDGTKEELDGGWPEHLADIVLALLKGTD